jgi:hypothetical protein
MTRDDVLILVIAMFAGAIVILCHLLLQERKMTAAIQLITKEDDSSSENLEQLAARILSTGGVIA